MTTILNTAWGLIVSLLGHAGWSGLWMAGAAGAVMSLYAIFRLVQGRLRDAGNALLGAAGLTVPALIGWGLCRLYSHVNGREIDSWFWAGGGAIFGLLVGLGAANDLRRDKTGEK